MTSIFLSTGSFTHNHFSRDLLRKLVDNMKYSGTGIIKVHFTIKGHSSQPLNITQRALKSSGCHVINMH